MRDNPITIAFYEISDVEDHLLEFAVIVARHRGEWIFCRHRDRKTWEIPGGHREPGEDILATARRELYKETGARTFLLEPICVYVVETEGEVKNFGLLCYAEVETLGPLPEMEITQIQMQNDLPAALTYPQIQPVLFQRIYETMELQSFQ